MTYPQTQLPNQCYLKLNIAVTLNFHACRLFVLFEAKYRPGNTHQTKLSHSPLQPMSYLSNGPERNSKKIEILTEKEKLFPLPEPFDRIFWNAQSDELFAKIVVYHPFDRFRFIMTGMLCFGNGLTGCWCMTVIRCLITGCFQMFYRCWWWLFIFGYDFCCHFLYYRSFSCKMLTGHTQPFDTIAWYFT